MAPCHGHQALVHNVTGVGWIRNRNAMSQSKYGSNRDEHCKGNQPTASRKHGSRKPLPGTKQQP